MQFLKTKNIKWYITKQLANLNFSIALLLLIAILSILGTIIEQDQTLNYYKLNYPIIDNSIYTINWQIIMTLGFDHMYSTWWFLSLLTLFFCSLITCTFSRQLPGLRNARNWKFIKPTNKKIDSHTYKLFEIKAMPNIVYALNLKYYYVFQKQNKIYAYKGIIGRIAPIFVHISIILTLTGSIIGLFNGFMVQQMIPNGETFHIQNVVKSGSKSFLPYNIIGKIDDFWIDYNSNNSIEQFYSYISLFNNDGKYLIRKKIYVNYPLKFHNLTFYQTDWQINSLRMTIGTKKNIQQNLNKKNIGDNSIWIYNLPINNHKNIFFLITGLKDKILVYNTEGKLIHKIMLNEKIRINNQDLIITEIMTSTGLQIKTDPGIPIVYTGFLILIISITISYLSYSQIWISNQQNSLTMAGITNRAKLTFEEDFINIQKCYLKSTLVK